MRSLTRLIGSAALIALAFAPAVARAAVTGAVEGVVTDQSTGKKLAGVTVTVTSPALQGEQTEFTDAAGHYIITELPPGEYLVRFYFSDKVVERPGVFVSSDRTLAVNVPFPTQQATVKTYRITEKAPTVDVGNTQVQTSVSSELVRNTPVRGRTYDAVLTLAPGATTDTSGGIGPPGLSFNGATGPENNFLIDGVNTTSPSFGLIGTQLTLEFVGETEIITGGYNAEYGRATGGVVNVITKSGSNQFHGGVWFYATPFQLDPNLVARSGEAIGSRTKTKYGFDFGFDLGGPIVKDKIWFYVGFAPTFTTLETTRSLRTRTANNAPMMGAYAGDLDASVTCPAYLAKGPNGESLCAAPGYHVENLGSQYDTHYTRDSRLYNWIAKFNFQLNPNNSLILQYVGSPATRDGTNGATYNASPGVFKSSTFDNTHDALLHYVSKLADRRLQLDLVFGYHFEDSKETPDAANNGNDILLIDTTVAPLTRYENVDPCKDRVINNGVVFNPCPVQNYRFGGLGQYSHVTEQRVSLQASATYFARLAGTHALKLGFDFEDNIYQNHRQYTGGRFITYIGGPGGTAESQAYATVLPDKSITALPDGFTATTSTFNYSLYLRDSYNVGFVPGLTINAGVRWEAQEVKDITGKTQIGIYDNWAPRVGAIYDFTRKGRSKIYVSYGWFYENIPLDINDRQFSGEGLAIQDITPSMGCNINPTMTGVFGSGRVDAKSCKYGTPTRGQLNGGNFGVVSPVLKGQYSEEVVAGLQYDVGLDLVLGAAYIHRDLGRIIEDASPNGGVDYIIANPGDPTDQGVVKDLQKKIRNATTDTDRQTLQHTLSLYQSVSSFDKPKRNYDALVITANKRLSHNFLVLASYTYSRTLGNYPGLFQQSNGQLDPNISTQYDLRELLLNRSGPLPGDHPHNIKIQGSYFIPFGKNNVTLGLAFNGISGRPIEVLGRHPSYGANETFILPRGSGGRTPFVTSFDFHVSYRRQLSKVFGFEAYGDIFNLFNQQEITNVDDGYTTASRVTPIQNGTIADLKNLKTISGTEPVLNPNYGRATQYQAPLSMRLGLRLSF